MRDIRSCIPAQRYDASCDRERPVAKIPQPEPGDSQGVWKRAWHLAAGLAIGLGEGGGTGGGGGGVAGLHCGLAKLKPYEEEDQKEERFYLQAETRKLIAIARGGATTPPR